MFSKMAATNVSAEMESVEDEETSLGDVCVDEIYARMKEITSLVVMARLQAREAEIRARYATEFAQRAVAEAKSAHQVSETLAKTSRTVALLALDFSNNTDSYLDTCVDTYADSGQNTRHSSFIDQDWSFQTVGDTSGLSNEDVSLTCASPGQVMDSNSRENLQGTIEHKYDATYPEDVATDDSERMVTKMPTLWETSRNEAEDNADDTLAPRKLTIAEEMKRLELKRRMLLYKDSKLVANMRKSYGTGDAQVHQREPTAYEERATQTNVSVMT